MFFEVAIKDAAIARNRLGLGPSVGRITDDRSPPNPDLVCTDAVETSWETELDHGRSTFSSSPDNSGNVIRFCVVGNIVMPSKKNSDNDGLRRRAARMAASLDPRDHAVLALRFGENLSVGETAAVLKMNPDEVRSAVNRAVGVLHRTGTA